MEHISILCNNPNCLGKYTYNKVYKAVAMGRYVVFINDDGNVSTFSKEGVFNRDSDNLWKIVSNKNITDGGLV
jgi:hypothetical protein